MSNKSSSDRLEYRSSEGRAGARANAKKRMARASRRAAKEETTHRFLEMLSIEQDDRPDEDEEIEQWILESEWRLGNLSDGAIVGDDEEQAAQDLQDACDLCCSDEDESHSTTSYIDWESLGYGRRD